MGASLLAADDPEGWGPLSRWQIKIADIFRMHLWHQSSHLKAMHLKVFIIIIIPP